MKYRIAAIQDISQLKELGLNAYGQFKSVLTEENWNRLHNILTDESTYADLLSKSTCFVCEYNNIIIGMAFFISKGNPTDIFQEDWSYLRMVGVNTAFQGKGIAKKLMQISIDHAKITGEKFIALHTSEFMDAARHIYENLKFRQIKELETRLGKRYWLYMLEI